jgi:hypothetical protein
MHILPGVSEVVCGLTGEMITDGWNTSYTRQRCPRAIRGLAGIGLSGGWAISAPGSISAKVDARASVAANTRQSALNDNVGR